MATIVIDSAASGTGTGTPSDPFRSVSSVVPSAGDVIAFMCGRVYREGMPNSALAANNLRLTTYGTGAPPVIMGSTNVEPYRWNRTSVDGIYSFALGSNVGGNLVEDGVPLQSVAWNTNLVTTAAAMVPGTMSYDFNTSTMYVCPSYGTLVGHDYEVSSILSFMQNSTGGVFSGLEVEGLEFRNFSRHPFDTYNRAKQKIHHNRFIVAGGHCTGGVYVGNGVQLSYDCNDSEVFSNYFEDIFDSPISPQIFTTGRSISRVKIYDNTILRCGLYGVETTVTAAATNATISDVDVYRNLVQLAGYNWRQFTVTGRALHVGGGTSATNTVNNVVHRDNVCIDCRWGLSDNTRICASSGNRFTGNIVTTKNSPGNGRGVYITGPALFEANVLDGYTYGAVAYGTTGAPVMPLYNNTFVNCQSGLVQDGTTGTIQLRNNYFWHTGQWVQNFQAGMTRDFEYNAVRAAAGAVTTGMTLSGTNIRPAVPQVDENYRPVGGALIQAAGIHLGYRADADGQQYSNPPSMGAYEVLARRDRRIA